LASVELGFKGKYLNRRLQVNGSMFFYDYSDLQVAATTTNCPTGAPTCNLTTNAAKAQSYGLELEGRYLVTSADRINFGLGLTNATYTSFKTTGNPVQDWSGKALDKSPAMTLNLGYSHQFNLESGAAVTAYIGERFSGEYELSNSSSNLRYKQDAYNKTDMHVTYASPDDKWSLQGYVRNIEDRNVATSTLFGGGQNTVFLAEPRMVGLRANMKF
jgi:iron complex outermembrane receptor protein